MAAEMPVKAPVLNPPPFAAYNWTGLYVGIQGGYAWGNSVQYFNAAPPFVLLFGTTDRYDVRGVLGGGTLGYNWQVSPRWVVGLEADWSAANVNGSTTSSPTYGCGTVQPVVECTSDVRTLGTVRGRIGFAAENFLFFATGGYAHGRISTGCCNLILQSTVNRSGWTAGGGIEYAVIGGLSAKFEYLFARFDDFTWTQAFGCHLFDCRTDVNLNIVRLGVNYRFGSR